jgi:hypothetical protein
MVRVVGAGTAGRSLLAGMIDQALGMSLEP